LPLNEIISEPQVVIQRPKPMPIVIPIDCLEDSYNKVNKQAEKKKEILIWKQTLSKYDRNIPEHLILINQIESYLLRLEASSVSSDDFSDDDEDSFTINYNKDNLPDAFMPETYSTDMLVLPKSVKKIFAFESSMASV